MDYIFYHSIQHLPLKKEFHYLIWHHLSMVYQPEGKNVRIWPPVLSVQQSNSSQILCSKISFASTHLHLSVQLFIQLWERHWSNWGRSSWERMVRYQCQAQERWDQAQDETPLTTTLGIITGRKLLAWVSTAINIQVMYYWCALQKELLSIVNYFQWPQTWQNIPLAIMNSPQHFLRRYWTHGQTKLRLGRMIQPSWTHLKLQYKVLLINFICEMIWKILVLRSYSSSSLKTIGWRRSKGPSSWKGFHPRRQGFTQHTHCYRSRFGGWAVRLLFMALLHADYALPRCSLATAGK